MRYFDGGRVAMSGVTRAMIVEAIESSENPQRRAIRDEGTRGMVEPPIARGGTR